MSYCGIENNDALSMATPVENLFIQEFLPKAPSDYVKVYLFALMQSTYPQLMCKNLSRFAADVQMSEDRVQKAINYWCAQRLMTRAEGGFLMRSVRSAISDGAEGFGGMMFEPELINRVNEAAGEIELSAAEYRLLGEVYEYCDFEPDAAVAFLTYCKKHCRNKNKKTLSFKRMESLLREWRQKDIKSAESARKFLLERDIESSDANAVLLHIGVARRTASVNEYELYNKWMELGFDLDAVKEACAGMTASQNPNFKYLDAVLAGLYKRGLTKASAIRADRNETDSEKRRVQSCNYILGVSGIVTKEQREYLRRWSGELGLADDVIYDLCREAHSSGLRDYKGAETFINSFVLNHSKNAGRAEVCEDAALDALVRRVLLECGAARAPSPSDKNAARRWLADFSEELVIEAAKAASGAQKPVAYISRVLADWKARGVDTLEKARQSASRPPESQKKQNGSGFAQREYKPGEFDDLFD